MISSTGSYNYQAETLHRRKHLCHRAEANHFHPCCERIPVLAGVDHEGALRVQIGSGMVKSPLQSGRKTALDFDSPTLAGGKFQQQIDLCAGGGPVEGELRLVRRGGNQIRARCISRYLWLDRPLALAGRACQAGQNGVIAEERTRLSGLWRIDKFPGLC